MVQRMKRHWQAVLPLKIQLYRYKYIKNQITLNNENEISQYYEIIKDTSNIKLNIMKSIEVINDDEDQDYEEDEEYEENSEFEYITVDEDSLNNGKVVLIDEPIEGFKEIKTVYDIPTIFVNMDTYNKIEENLKNENEENMSVGNTEAIKIKCDNVIEFANYIQDISIKKNCPIIVEYYTLENKEKCIKCGLCSYVCPCNINLKEVLNK